jgi:hypothetical protein
MTGPAAPRPLGRHQLTRLASRLSDRDMAVVGSLAAYRFLSATQIERLHFPVEAHTPLGAVRASRRSLERLTRHGVLRRLERRIGGVRAGSAGFVYCLGPAGVRLVNAGRRRAIALEPSTAFLAHSLAVAEVVVTITEATRASALELLDIQVEPACWRRFYGVGGASELLKPDLYVVLGLGDIEQHWFVEVDLASEHRPTLERKVAQYERYLRSGREQEHLGVFPGVAWLVPSAARAEVLRSVAAAAMQGLFSVGLLDEVVLTLVREPAEYDKSNATPNKEGGTS